MKNNTLPNPLLYGNIAKNDKSVSFNKYKKTIVIDYQKEVSEVFNRSRQSKSMEILSVVKKKNPDSALSSFIISKQDKKAS